MTLDFIGSFKADRTELAALLTYWQHEKRRIERVSEMKVLEKYRYVTLLFGHYIATVQNLVRPVKTAIAVAATGDPFPLQFHGAAPFVSQTRSPFQINIPASKSYRLRARKMSLGQSWWKTVVLQKTN